MMLFRRNHLYKHLVKHKNTIVALTRCKTTQKPEKESTEEEAWSIVPHINYPDISQRKELYKENLKNRNMQHLVSIDNVVELYEKQKQIDLRLNHARHDRNQIAQGLAGKPHKPLGEKEIVSGRKYSDEEKKKLIEIGRQLKEECTQLEKQVKDIRKELLSEALKIPNLSHPDVPVGGMEHQKILKQVEGHYKPEKPLLDHYEIVKRLNLVEFDRASMISGSKFYYLKNELVLMELALQQFAINKLIQKGYMIMTTPELVRRQVMEGCGFQPRGEHTQIYSIENSDLCLIGTSEIPLAGMYAGKIIPLNQLPIKLAGVSHCFRTEAGAAGLTNKGLYRVHQFTKVEMFIFCKPEESEAKLQELIEIEEEIFSELGIPYRVVLMPTEDLGGQASKKIDIEAWMPGKETFGEISSASNCTDYQARRLMIRFKNAVTGDINYVHTLNATALAVPRIIISILENNQFYKNGKIAVHIPKALQPYMNGISVLEEK